VTASGDLLHAVVLVAAAFGIGCVIAQRPRMIRAVACDALMLIAMIDSNGAGILAVVVWAVALLGAAMVTSALSARGAPGVVSTEYLQPVAMILMAGLMLSSSSMHTVLADVTDQGHVAHAAVSIAALLWGGVIAFVVATVAAIVREWMVTHPGGGNAKPRLDVRRLGAKRRGGHQLAMAATVVAMGLATVL